MNLPVLILPLIKIDQSEIQPILLSILRYGRSNTNYLESEFWNLELMLTDGQRLLAFFIEAQPGLALADDPPAAHLADRGPRAGG